MDTGTLTPKHPPLPKHINIVAIESHYVAIPPLRVPAGHTFTLTTHFRSTASEVIERIRDAHIVITTIATMTAEALSPTNAPHLRMITAMAVGTDLIDLAACKSRNITVLNTVNCNTQTVAEHALTLALTVRRSIVPTMQKTAGGAWKASGTLVKETYADDTPPRTLRQETVGIIGYGAVGQATAAIFRSLGSTVLIARHKGQSASADSGRVSFAQVLDQSTVVVLCCPRCPETEGLLGAAEFQAMRRDAVLVNVARGGVVVEEALVDALRDGEIAGAGVDVYEHAEPLGPEESVLIGREGEGLNLVTTPHTAWISLETIEGYQRVCQENVYGFLEGKVKEERVVVNGGGVDVE